MKNILISTLTLLTIHLGIYSQEIQNFHSSEKSDNLIEIDPILIDEFVKLYVEKEIDQVYSMVADDIKLYNSKENFSSYREMYERYFGKVLSYEQKDLKIATNDYLGQFVTVNYIIEFERYLGKAIGVFQVKDTSTVKMYSFSISMNEFFTIEKRDSIAKPIMNAIIKKDIKKAYNLTSLVFQEDNSFSTFKKQIKEIFKVDIVDYKIYGYKFGLKESKENLNISYLINETGYLELFFTNRDGNFEFEGLDYKSKFY